MTNSFEESLDSVSNAPKGVSRRAVSTAAAWTVPAVAVAVGAPMAAASPATAGTITFSPIPVTAKPGGKFSPNLVVTATANTGTIDSPLTVTVNAPVGVVFIDPVTGVRSTTKVVILPATGTGTSSFTITDVFATEDSAPGTHNTAPGGVTTPANWPNTNTPVYEVVVNVIPGTGKGAVWAQNVNTETFATNGAPIKFASPLDGLDDTPAWITSGSNVVDYNTSQDGTLILADGAGGTKWITGGNASNGGTHVGNPGYFYYAQDNSFLGAGEYLISTSLANEVLSTHGQVWYVVNGARFHYAFVDATWSPTSAFITQIRGGAWLSALDSAGHVWTHIGLDPTQSSSPIEQITPKLVSYNGAPLKDIVEVGENGLALGKNGEVYQISQDSNRVATLVGSDGAKLARNATTNAWAYITTTGQVKSWGDGNQNRHTSANSLSVASPTVNQNVESIRGSRTVLDFAFGEQAATVVIYSDNTVYAWGDGFAGQLGNNGAPADSAGPVQVLAGPLGSTPAGPLAASAFYSSRRAFGVKVA